MRALQTLQGVLRAWLPLLLALTACADVLGLDDPQASDGAGSGSGNGSGSGSGPTARTCSGVKYGGSCYERHPPAVDWMTARDTCIVDGGWLATISTINEAFALDDILSVPDVVYVGASDLDTPGKFTWVDDGIQLTSEAWNPMQPDYKQDEHCVVGRSSTFRFGMDDHICKDPVDFICERPL